MISDEERREVARRLRENAEAHPDMSLILNLAFADDSLKPDGAMEWKVTSYDAAMRLADLIDPSCDRDAPQKVAEEMDRRCRYFPECQRCNEVGDSWIPCTGGADGIQCDAYEPMPDVDALLALAETLDQDALLYRETARSFIECGNHDAAEICYEAASDDNGYARLIREALGVEND